MAGAHAMAGARGTSTPVINVNAGDYTNASTGGAAQSFTVGSNGSVDANGYSSYNWNSVPATAGQYDVEFVTGFGAVSSGTTDTRLPLSSSRAIEVTRATLGSKIWSGEVVIRRISDNVEMDRAAISITATVEPGG